MLDKILLTAQITKLRIYLVNQTTLEKTGRTCFWKKRCFDEP